MTFYVIRHKATQELMPQCKRRGYTHWNPSTNSIPDTALGVPRLIDTRQKAFRCIIQWANLPNAHNTYDHDGEADVDIKNDNRKKEDLEIVEVELVSKGKDNAS